VEELLEFHISTYIEFQSSQQKLCANDQQAKIKRTNEETSVISSQNINLTK
jgi:hypothetical protein